MQVISVTTLGAPQGVGGFFMNGFQVPTEDVTWLPYG